MYCWQQPPPGPRVVRGGKDRRLVALGRAGQGEGVRDRGSSPQSRIAIWDRFSHPPHTLFPGDSWKELMDARCQKGAQSPWEDSRGREEDWCDSEGASSILGMQGSYLRAATHSELPFPLLSLKECFSSPFLSSKPLFHLLPLLVTQLTFRQSYCMPGNYPRC
jgi:hypothetical protein